jgi:hypothetical protein
MRRVIVGMLAFFLAQPAFAAEGGNQDPALEELIEILRERGVLRDGDEEAIEKAAAEDPAWYEKCTSTSPSSTIR